MAEDSGASRRVHDGVRTTVVGNLTKDPVHATTQNGDPWARFTIASNERYRSPDGTWKSLDPVFTEVSVFGANALAAVSELHQGDRVEAVGRPRVEKFVRKDGTPDASLQVTAFSVAAAPLPKKDPDGAAPAAAPVPPPLPEPPAAAQPALGM